MSKKIAFITGGSRGIGAACASALGSAGYHVALHYRTDRELAEKIASDISDVSLYQGDLSQPEDIERICKDLKKDFGKIDVCVNNAGANVDQMITFAKAEDLDRLLTINVKSVFLVSKYLSKMMIKQKSGSIINITSVVGHTGNAGQSMYSATKGAVTAMTKSMAKDLAGFGIRCNCIAPGFIATDMTDRLDDKVQEELVKTIPMRRIGSAAEIGSVASFLASDASSYITGTTIHVNGGMY